MVYGAKVSSIYNECPCMNIIKNKKINSCRVIHSKIKNMIYPPPPPTALPPSVFFWSAQTLC